MSRLNREVALAVIQHLYPKADSPGNRMTYYHAIDHLHIFVVRECSDELRKMQEWTIPGLWIANNDIVKSPRSSIVVLYLMRSGEVMALVVPKMPVQQIPFNILEKDVPFGKDVELGFKVDHQQWVEIPDLDWHKFVVADQTVVVDLAPEGRPPEPEIPEVPTEYGLVESYNIQSLWVGPGQN